nr:hypothetical protein PHYPA_002292 [Physcomitrium patens]
MEGKGLVSILYTYRSCVKALPQLSESMKDSQADLYLETYQVLDIEIGRLREIQRWQSSAAFKLAVDMHNYTQSIKKLNGPSVTHMWAMLRLLDILLQLDHLKNAKASIPNDFSWYKRTFTQVSVNWPDTEQMREELDDLQIFLSTRWTILLNLQQEIFRVNGVEDIIQVLILFTLECLESDRVLVYSERHTLLRVLPVLVVLATSGEKEGESIFKKIKISRLMNIFKLETLNLETGVDVALKKRIKENVYLVVVAGFQLLSEWTGRVWQQSAWKFSRPAKDSERFDAERSVDVTDYEKVVRCNYTAEERKALIEAIGYIKGVGIMMERADTLVANTVWESIHTQLQDFVQSKIPTMLRTSLRRKKEIARLLSDMRTIAADWQGKSPQVEKVKSRKLSREDNLVPPVSYHPRAAFPTAAQLHCLQYLIHEIVTGGSPKKAGGFFTASETEVPSSELRQLESFFNRLAFFPHVIDYRATLAHVTDLGFLWFREFYLETSRVIQFPVECSLPWMLVEHIMDSSDIGLLESILLPFDIYNDAADQALRVLKQRFLYDEIEAEVDLCFDQLVSQLSDQIFIHYKSRAASKMLDMSFMAAVNDHEKYYVLPKRYDHLFRIRRVKMLGRNVDLAHLIRQRLNKVFRENLDFLFDRFESQDLCSVVDLQRLVEVLRLTHELISEHIAIDPFNLMMGEISETISLVSFSGRLASQVLLELQNDFFPNFMLCTTTQRFVRSSKPPKRPIKRPSSPFAEPSFLFGNIDLNEAHGVVAELHSKFFGLPHMFAVVKLLGSRSLPWLVRALLDYLSQKILVMEPWVEDLRDLMPKAISLPPYDAGVEGSLNHFTEQLQWAVNYDGRPEMLQGLKEIGSLIFWMSLLDTAMRETETVHFMQVVPWLGVVPNKDGQLQQLLCDDNYSPVVSLFKEATDEVLYSTSRVNGPAFQSMAKQAEVVDILYMNNLQTGSVLDYTLTYLHAILSRSRVKWDLPPKSGLIEITLSKEYHRIYSGLQYTMLQGVPPSVQSLLLAYSQISPEGDSFQDRYGDAVAWGGCTILYLLGQQLRFELLDFAYHVLSASEAESLPSAQELLIERSKSGSAAYSMEVVAFLANAKKARRLNNYVFSLLRACSPHEDRLASMVKQSGVVVHSFKYPVTPSLLNHLPFKGDEDEEDANVHGPSSTTGFGVPTPDQTSCIEDLLKNSRNITESPL